MNKEKKLSQEEAAKTAEELDQLTKSEEEVIEDGISELEKAILDMENGDDSLEKSDEEADLDEDGIEKSDDEDADDEDGIEKSDDEDADDEDGEEEEDEDMEKSEELDFDNFEEELQKASEAYAELEGTVAETREMLKKGQDDLADEIATLTSLTVKIGKGMIALKKSVDAMASQPAKASGVVLVKSEDDDADMKKSIAQVRNALTEECQKDDGADPKYLGVLASRGIDGLKKALEAHDETALIEKLGL